MGHGKKQMPEAPASARRQWAADRALRPTMRSPGRPEPSRAVQRDFWRRIASGVTTVEASEAVGVSWPVGARWFRHAGRMPPISLDEPPGRYLSFAECEEIALLRAQDIGVREISRRIGRGPGNDLTRAPPQCRDQSRPARLPRSGGAVEGTAGREAPEDRQAPGRETGCASTYRNGSPGAFGVPTARSSPGLSRLCGRG